MPEVDAVTGKSINPHIPRMFRLAEKVHQKAC